MHASSLKRGITEAKFSSFCSWLPKPNLYCRPLKLPSVEKNGCENNAVHLHFSVGIFSCFVVFFNSSTFPSQHSGGFFLLFFVLTKLSESQKARQIKRICYHLEFFF